MHDDLGHGGDGDIGQVCYGMLYGIGAHSLGQQMSMDEKEAAVFMESFKAKYGG